jgi:hypothetical protein
MSTNSLFHESITEAIKDTINACGGSKQVAAKLWPEKAPDAAHRLLLSCLNDDRPERLSPEQLMFVLRMGREKGVHVGITYILRELGYDDPKPIEPTDELAELQRNCLELLQQQARMAARMEKLMTQGAGSHLRSVAA